MVGRYEIISEMMPRPMPASTKAMNTRQVPGGRTKPKVSSDEPLVTNASLTGRTPVPQPTAAKPITISATHRAGSRTRASGA